MDDSQWLNRAEQAALLGVGTATIAQYVRRHGPSSPNPYPVWVEGQHKTFGKSVAVQRSALIEWDKRRPGANGRPRLHPPITGAQHRALAAIAAGHAPVSRTTRHLSDRGLVTVTARLTPAGRELLAAWPGEEL